MAEPRRRRRARAGWLATVAIAAALAAPPAARLLAAQESGSAGDLGQLLALEDSKSFDGVVLERAVRHPDSLVRRYAAIVLGRLGDPAGVPLLRRLLADPDSQVRIEAAFASGTLGSRDLAPDLAHLVERFPGVVTGDFEVEVVTALAKIGGPDAERSLDGILERHPPSLDPDDRATAAALLETWRLGPSSAPARRLAGYVRDARAAWRLNATFSAARLRLPAAGPALLEAASDSDALTRSWAARGLVASEADSAGLPRAAFTARLRTLVSDADPRVRINALRALATYADSALAPVAAARLTDRDANVPVQAAATLGSLGGAQAAATLAERFPGAGSFGLRRAILLALAACSPTTALETARAWRTDTDWLLRATYAEMLAVAATPAARQQLEAMADDPDARVAGFALGGLEQVVRAGDRAVLALATRKLADPDVIVRATAIGILGREHDPALLPVLLAAYRRAGADPLADARLAAVRALADLADSVPTAADGVRQALLEDQPRPRDYLVRRLAEARFGAAAVRRTWGPALPIVTGRSVEEYRDLARRFLLGAAPPGTLTIETDRGSVGVLLYAQDAPLTVDNFLRLVDRRFFDGGRWHRVVPNFVAQDGDPRGDGSGGPGTTIRDEINRHRYDQGTVGMALAGPDTGGSQFFITFSPQPHLDGGYTVFGQVVSGWDSMSQVVQGDRIRRIYR